jgi:hypothetical protein
LTITVVCGSPFAIRTELAQSNYRPPSTDTANALSRRRRSPTTSPPITRPLAVSAPRRPLGDGWEKPEAGVA